MTEETAVCSVYLIFTAIVVIFFGIIIHNVLGSNKEHGQCADAGGIPMKSNMDALTIYCLSPDVFLDYTEN